jgi:HD-GYP domain-containing protein (c-di-GMP phosphodiesterase class II)
MSRTSIQISADWQELLDSLAGQAAIAIDNATLFDQLQKTNEELISAYDTTLDGWIRALDLRDRASAGHTQRVIDLTLQLALKMGLREEELVNLRRGALLHDVGNIGIPDRILQKPGNLDEDEWNLVRQHPMFAYEMISPITYLRAAIDIPYCHHEKWDGSGYPRGLAGEYIPLAARIFSVVDVWDALISDRPYRPAWSWQEALEYIESQAGTGFDPAVVRIFMTIV